MKTRLVIYKCPDLFILVKVNQIMINFIIKNLNKHDDATRVIKVIKSETLVEMSG